MTEKTIEELKEEVKNKEEGIKDISEREQLEKRSKQLDFKKNHHKILNKTQAIENTVVGTIKGLFNVLGQGVKKLNELDEKTNKKQKEEAKELKKKGIKPKSFEEELNDSMDMLK